MKFEIGKPYKTTDGGKAIILKIQENKMLVWHEKQPQTPVWHNLDGSRILERSKFTTDRDILRKQQFDITGEWTEPRKGTGLLVMDYDGRIWLYRGIMAAREKQYYLANKRVELIEGQFDE